MLRTKEYNRTAALQYAQKWAMSRNLRYLDFTTMGGDCTNFISQCLYAGSGVQNYTPTFGWYYNSAYDRTPSWSGVQYQYNFLLSNSGAGPFGSASSLDHLLIGDTIQLGNEEMHFYHNLMVAALTQDDVLVYAHDFDAYMRPLSTYVYANIRYIHLDGVRYWA